jgi:hypothetical protein
VVCAAFFGRLELAASVLVPADFLVPARGGWASDEEHPEEVCTALDFVFGPLEVATSVDLAHNLEYWSCDVERSEELVPVVKEGVTPVADFAVDLRGSCHWNVEWQEEVVSVVEEEATSESKSRRGASGPLWW